MLTTPVTFPHMHVCIINTQMDSQFRIHTRKREGIPLTQANYDIQETILQDFLKIKQMLTFASLDLPLNEQRQRKTTCALNICPYRISD